MSTIHVNRQGSAEFTRCGRRQGTPGGEIWPGVPSNCVEWFQKHRYPEALRGHVCKDCLSQTPDLEGFEEAA